MPSNATSKEGATMTGRERRSAGEATNRRRKSGHGDVGKNRSISRRAGWSRRKPGPCHGFITPAKWTMDGATTPAHERVPQRRDQVERRGQLHELAADEQVERGLIGMQALALALGDAEQLPGQPLGVKPADIHHQHPGIHVAGVAAGKDERQLGRARHERHHGVAHRGERVVAEIEVEQPEDARIVGVGIDVEIDRAGVRSRQSRPERRSGGSTVRCPRRRHAPAVAPQTAGRASSRRGRSPDR